MQLARSLVAFFALVGTEVRIFFCGPKTLPPSPDTGWVVDLHLGLNKAHHVYGTQGHPPLLSLFDAAGDDLWLRARPPTLNDKRIYAEYDPARYTLYPKARSWAPGAALPHEDWRMYDHDLAQWVARNKKEAAYALFEGAPRSDPVCISHVLLANPNPPARYTNGTGSTEKPSHTSPTAEATELGPRHVLRLADWAVECGGPLRTAWAWSYRWYDPELESQNPPRCVWLGDGRVDKGRIWATSALQVRWDVFSFGLPRLAVWNETQFEARKPDDRHDLCKPDALVVRNDGEVEDYMRLVMVPREGGATGTTVTKEWRMGPKWPMETQKPRTPLGGSGSTYPTKRDGAEEARVREGQRATSGSQAAQAAFFDGWLVQSNDPGHSARELCESPNSASPDAADWHRRQFCRMSDRTVFPFCSGKRFDQAECWSPETQQVVVRGMAKRGLPYTQVTDWRRQGQMERSK